MELFMHERFESFWLADLRIIHGIYKDPVTGESSSIGYQAFITNQGLIGGLARLRGVILDFREVTRFDNSNLVVTRNQSRAVKSSNLDLKPIAVALLIKTPMQKSFVGLTMQPEERTKMVWSWEEALAFINTYRKPFDDAETTEP